MKEKLKVMNTAYIVTRCSPPQSFLLSLDIFSHRFWTSKRYKNDVLFREEIFYIYACIKVRSKAGHDTHILSKISQQNF